MTMTIQKTPVGDYTLNMACNQSFTLANNVYSYGEQPPLFPGPVPLNLVNDTFQPGRGPAWFRMMPYNKTVIIPGPVLQPTTNPSQAAKMVKRFGDYGNGAAEFKRKGVAQIGDKPWICTWPETFLEIFIYPQQNSSWARYNNPSASSTMTGAPAVKTDSDDLSQAISSATQTPTTTSVNPAPTDNGPPDNQQPPPPYYPRVVKMEERRIDRSPTPVCRQFEIIRDGAPARPVKDDLGNDVVIYIAETESIAMATTSDETKSRPQHSRLKVRDSVPDLSQCGCMWFVT
jgi:hypothetical protein